MKVTVKVYEQEKYDNDWPPKEAVDFLQWFQDKIATVPDEFRPAVMIEINSYIAYGSSEPEILISYERDETPSEFAERERDRLAHNAAEERRERAKLAELRAKYGDQS